MRIWILLSILFAQTWVFAQRPTNSLLVVNPSLYNPAYVGYHQRSEVLVGYQQQWLGIRDAPSLASFQYHAAFSRHIGLGAQAARQTVGQYQHLQATLAFAYRVFIGPKAGLSFGLSGGFTQTGLNQQATYNPLDPAVSSLLETSLSPQAAFGANLRFSSLNVGIALPMLLPSATEILSDITTHEPYNQFIANIDYRFTFPSANIALRPFLLYHHDKSALSTAEAGSLVYFQKIVFAGGGYRLNYGPTIMAGLQLSDFRLGYNYEHPTAVINQIGQGGHELQFSYRFGNKKPKRKKENVSKSYTTSSDTIVSETAPAGDSKSEDQVQSEENHAIFYRGDHTDELGIGFYVIAGSFKNRENAYQQVQAISKEGTFASLGYNSQRAYYYIFIYRSGDLEKTRKARDEYRQNQMFQDAWLLEIRDR